MPTAARAGSKDKELATAAGNKVVVLRMFSADRVVEDGVRVHRAARVRDAFDAKWRDNRSVGTDGQAAKGWKTIDCKIGLNGYIEESDISWLPYDQFLRVSTHFNI